MLRGMAASSEQVEELSDEIEIRRLAAERLTFFSDAVVAIALTLLALALPIPDGSTNSAVLHSALAQSSAYIAFLISFLVIAAEWRAHHQLFRYVVSLNNRLTQLNIYWLFMLVITPFAIRVLNGHGAFQARFIFYATVQALASGLFMLITWEVRRSGLHRENIPSDLFSRAMRQGVVLALAFLLSIPVSFFSEWAYACWAFVPLVNLVITRVRARRRTT